MSKTKTYSSSYNKDSNSNFKNVCSLFIAIYRKTYANA